MESAARHTVTVTVVDEHGELATRGVVQMTLDAALQCLWCGVEWPLEGEEADEVSLGRHWRRCRGPDTHPQP